MIIGQIAQVAAQKNVLPAAVVRALEALQKVDLDRAEVGHYQVEGDELFYMVQEIDSRALEDCRAEAHRKYADIQIPLSAPERFGFSLPQPGLPTVEDSFAEKDIAFYETPANEFFMNVEPGEYVVFMPGELHRPAVSISGRVRLRKIVVKVSAKLLGL